MKTRRNPVKHYTIADELATQFYMSPETAIQAVLGAAELCGGTEALRDVWRHMLDDDQLWSLIETLRAAEETAGRLRRSILSQASGLDDEPTGAEIVAAAARRAAIIRSAAALSPAARENRARPRTSKQAAASNRARETTRAARKKA
ncbi:MAG: hypothetical protein ACREB3_09030 [Burkholderiales bacterium]